MDVVKFGLAAHLRKYAPRQNGPSRRNCRHCNLANAWYGRVDGGIGALADAARGVLVASHPPFGCGGAVLSGWLGFGSLMGLTIRLFGRSLHLPGLLTITAILALTVLDTMAAATTLYILMPDSIALPFHSLYPVFLLALGAALISGTPGGVGPFEITLLALFPGIGAEPILGAVLAFRLIYYALPAIIGMGILARGPARGFDQTPTLSKPDGAALDFVVQNAPFAEAHLLHQDDKMLLSQLDHGASLMVSRTGQALIALRDPLAEKHGAAPLETLTMAAPNRLQFCIAAFDIAREITNKRPISAEPS